MFGSNIFGGNTFGGNTFEDGGRSRYIPVQASQPRRPTETSVPVPNRIGCQNIKVPSMVVTQPDEIAKGGILDGSSLEASRAVQSCQPTKVIDTQTIPGRFSVKEISRAVSSSTPTVPSANSGRRVMEIGMNIPIERRPMVIPQASSMMAISATSQARPVAAISTLPTVSMAVSSPTTLVNTQGPLVPVNTAQSTALVNTGCAPVYQQPIVAQYGKRFEVKRSVLNGFGYGPDGIGGCGCGRC